MGRTRISTYYYYVVLVGHYCWCFYLTFVSISLSSLLRTFAALLLHPRAYGIVMAHSVTSRSFRPSSGSQPDQLPLQQQPRNPGRPRRPRLSRLHSPPIPPKQSACPAQAVRLSRPSSPPVLPMQSTCPAQASRLSRLLSRPSNRNDRQAAGNRSYGDLDVSELGSAVGVRFSACQVRQRGLVEACIPHRAAECRFSFSFSRLQGPAGTGPVCCCRCAPTFT